MRFILDAWHYLVGTLAAVFIYPGFFALWFAWMLSEILEDRRPLSKAERACIFACAAWYLLIYYVGIFSLVVWMVRATIP